MSNKDQNQGEPVTLPARKDGNGPSLSNHRSYNQGWNAYRDAMEKWGPLYTHADPAEAEPVSWEQAMRVADMPGVHEALQMFSEDPTGDAGISLVRELLEVTQAVPAEVERITWEQIVALVNEVLGCEAHKWPVHDVGHQMTGINFNSLARIIDRVQRLRPAHADPGEVESLKADKQAFAQNAVDLRAEVERLRAQLHDLAMAIYKSHYAKTAPNFEPFDFASGLIGQIDNMVAGLLQDVSTLRGDVETMRRKNNEYWHESEAMRAQLAEMQALLSKAYKDMEDTIGQSWCISCHQGPEDDGVITHDPSCTFCAMEVALSTMAEPGAPIERDELLTELAGLEINGDKPYADIPDDHDEYLDANASAALWLLLNVGRIRAALERKPNAPVALAGLPEVEAGMHKLAVPVIKSEYLYVAWEVVKRSEKGIPLHIKNPKEGEWVRDVVDGALTAWRKLL